jgi:hypothetical protein
MMAVLSKYCLLNQLDFLSKGNNMKIRIIVLLALLVPALVSAEQGVKRETVERLLKVMQAEKIIDVMYAQIDKMFQGLGRDLGVKESEQAIFDKYVSKVTTAMKEEMSWQKMKEPMIDVYIKHYTEKEMNDLAEFYSSESGKSIINKMPAVMEDSMLISRSMLKDFLPKMQQISMELQQELEESRKAQQQPPQQQ